VSGVDGWFPPTSDNPLPVAVVDATSPAVDTWYPPTATNPLPVAVISGLANLAEFQQLAAPGG
jgi:hypothetical protein